MQTLTSTTHSLRGIAPRRFRLSQAVNNGDRIPRLNFLSSNPATFMAVVPIAAPCYAVRLGFANGFNFTQTISTASIYPSDSYSHALEVLYGETGPVAPTCASRVVHGSPIYFDGIGDQSLNLNGLNRSLSLPAASANARNAIVPYSITWSDWAPCTSLPRADGGQWPLLFIYITITSRSFVSTASSYLNFNATLNRGKRMVGGLRARTRDIDFADRPTETEWETFGQPPLGPWFIIQYLTTMPSVQIVITGDSLSAAPQTDGISNAIWRAAADLSSERLPIEVLNLAVGAADWRVYNRPVAKIA